MPMEFNMFIADMHCDSLLTVNGDTGLVNPYNFSTNNPQLQFVASFLEKGNTTPEQRRRQLMKHLNVYLYECERLGLMKIQEGRDVFRAVDNELRSVTFTVEGGGGLFDDSKELDALATAGLSVLGLCWDDNELASSAWTNNDVGLSGEGRALVQRCNSLGVTLDVSHLSDKSFYDLMEISPMPVLATHSNFREVSASPRNLTRDMAREIAARGGVIGLNIYPPFLSESGKAEKEDILRHIDYGLSLLGDRHIGFGFDIDGTDGQYPAWIDPTVSMHDQVIDLLLSHYSSATVERIAGLNVIDFLKDNLS